MSYDGLAVAVTGSTGFLGKAIVARLRLLGAQVTELTDDVRDRWTFESINPSFSYLFHFGAPSSQVLFKRSPKYCIDVTVNGFINAARACEENGVKLVYPSTGLLSSGRFNEYAMCKKLCEDMHLGSGLDALGLRIFATYGPGESHKRDYASVPYLFAKDILNRRRPVVYGDGTQVRDFIYIDDTVNAILELADSYDGKIVDIGSGESVSFNKIIRLLNTRFEDQIIPKYISSPKGYVSETHALITEMAEYYTPRVSLEQGISNMMDAVIDIESLDIDL